MLLLSFVMKVIDKGIIDFLKRYMYPDKIIRWIISPFPCFKNSIQKFSFKRKTNTLTLADSEEFIDILQIQFFVQYMHGNRGGRWKKEIYTRIIISELVKKHCHALGSRLLPDFWFLLNKNCLFVRCTEIHWK